MQINREIRLRPWTAEDIPALVDLANDISIARYMTDQFPHPYTGESGARFIDFANADQPTRIFAIEYLGNVAGSIGLHPQSDVHKMNAELGYWVGKPYRNQGLLSSVLPEFIRFSFSHFPVNRIFARIYGSNAASVRVVEKAGMVLEARFFSTILKFDETEDELIYAIRRDATMLST